MSLEDFESVKRWFRNVPKESTRGNYLRALRRLVNRSGLDPDRLVELGRKDPEKAHDLLKDLYNGLNLAESSRNMIYQSLRSFFTHNGVQLGPKPRSFGRAVEHEPRKVYTQGEVAELVDAASCTRDKAIICVLAQSGQRVGILTGLNIEHLDLDAKPPIVVRVPSVLRNREGKNVNKNRKPYRFALGTDSHRYLNLMIEERLERGEEGRPESPLFRSYSKYDGRMPRKVDRSEPGSPLSRTRIGQIVRDAAESHGIQEKHGKRYLFHPHGFRRYWKHQMRMGEADPTLLKFMMGQNVEYQGAYDQWTDDDIRKVYASAEEHLALRPGRVKPEHIREEIFKILMGKVSDHDLEEAAKKLGIPPREVEKALERE